MARTRVKFCGITRLEDALIAADLGVDAIGFVFWSASPRCISAAEARAIKENLPPFMTTVGVFVDEQPAVVGELAASAGIDLLQFHGGEPPVDCRAPGLPYIKAIQMRPEVNLRASIDEYGDAAALLVDSYHAEIPGGTGISFQWDRVPAELPKPLILAGGLNADNVADAIQRVRPYGVDVSGGIESAKGIKHADKMECFMAEVRKGECAG